MYFREITRNFSIRKNFAVSLILRFETQYLVNILSIKAIFYTEHEPIETNRREGAALIKMFDIGYTFYHESLYFRCTFMKCAFGWLY